jgi:UDP-hydrolysing UDP-N-acetyl-D-glucosamine 2-epimerase
MKKKILFFSGSRSDYDLIFPFYKLVKKNRKFITNLLITGTNLDKKYCNNKNNQFLKNKFFKIKVPLKLSDKKNFSKILSKYFLEFYNFLYKTKPDLVIILGDRYEALSFAICAKFCNCKILHLHGGEKTDGSLDNIWRDVITRLSDYHFTSLSSYKKKVQEICRKPGAVFNFGSIGAYNVSNSKCKKIFFNKKVNKKILVSYHSSTSSISQSRKVFLELLKALTKFKKDLILFTYPGHDLDSDFIIKEIEKFKKLNDNCVVIKKATRFNYSDLLNSFDILVGNSSAGIIEAPSARIPTLNIGNRQKGRVFGPSVFNVIGKNDLIYNKINYIFKKAKINFKNPYYKKNVLKNMYSRIIKITKKL